MKLLLILILKVIATFFAYIARLCFSINFILLWDKRFLNHLEDGFEIIWIKDRSKNGTQPRQ